jgi:serine protease Do
MKNKILWMGMSLLLWVPGMTVDAIGDDVAANAASPVLSDPLQRPSAATGTPGGDIRPTSFSDLVRREKPAVVNVSTTQVLSDKFHKDLFRGFGHNGPEDGPKGFKSQSLGSGFIISKEGLILTNHHVVENAERIVVRLSDDREFTAEVIGKDSKTDLALIRIQGNGDFPVAALGDSDDLEVGDWVVAIGNPFGLEQTVTAGIVSAKGRVIGSGPYDDFIQTDASINPGNSGGPLFNLKGEVVGINTAINASGQGIGFAIPINVAKTLLPQLRDTGKVTRGWLGVMIQDVTGDLAKSFGLKERGGALVADVTDGGPAALGGVERGDVIMEFDGKKIARMKDLPILVAGTSVGKTVTLKMVRDGKEKQAEIRIGKLEEKETAAQDEERDGKNVDLGMQIQEIPDEAQEGYDADIHGVYVYRVVPGAPASDGGIQEGDVIMELDRKEIRNVARYRQLLREKKSGDTLLVLVRREEGSKYLTVKVP